MFTDAEIEAMVLGARLVSSWADPAMAKAASEALARVEAVLPDRLRDRLTSTPLFAPGFHVPSPVLERLAPLRGALESHRKVRLAYTDGEGSETERLVRPLGLFFWGTTWSLCAWCELRTDFRSFRLDRMRTMSIAPERFSDEPGRTIEDYFARVANGEDW
jgi:predicted DNA-binding transcriptional regulator YafY